MYRLLVHSIISIKAWVLPAESLVGAEYTCVYI
jgi:hypothetical protein